MTEKVENELAELETEPIVADPEIDDRDLMDTYIDIAKKIGEFEKAQTTILNYILRKTYAGDWISHSKQSEPVLMRNANITGAGAERIANALGIRETNWKRSEKQWSDDKKHYTYECQADFSIGRRTVTAYGRASSMDKFFGYANGQWKNLEDVKEDDIKVAAFRNCRKEGVRTLLGLRKIPIKKLQELGFNIDLVHMVNFKSAKAAIAELGHDGGENQAAAADAAEKQTQEVQKGLIANIIVREMKVRKYGETPIIDVVTDKGETYSWWGKKPENKEVQDLANMMAAGYLIQIEYRQKGQYKNVEKVLGGVPQ